MTGTPRGQAPVWLDVSRETLARLDAFLALVEKWNPAINLVARASLPAAWDRHVLDSAQLILLCPEKALRWVDFGSGAGFPGLVVGIVAQELRPDLRVTLVESDKRKASFLIQAARELAQPVAIIADRAETLPQQQADVVSARALAPLTDLCSLAARHLTPNGAAIFPKGARAEAELTDARTFWQFDAKIIQSHTDPAGHVITMQNIHHV